MGPRRRSPRRTAVGLASSRAASRLGRGSSVRSSLGEGITLLPPYGPPFHYGLPRALVRLAGSSFRDPTVHGNESRPSWIEGAWIQVRDLGECVSRGSNGRVLRRSRGDDTVSVTWWSARGSSCGLPTGMVQRGSPCLLGAAIGSCASGELAGRLARASSRSSTRRGAVGRLVCRCRLGARSSSWHASDRQTTA